MKKATKKDHGKHPCAVCRATFGQDHKLSCPHAPKAKRGLEIPCTVEITWTMGDPPVKDTNPKDAAASTRLDLSLVPDSAIAFCALGLTEGHRKYRGYNWRVAGVLVSVYVAALRRHMARFANGEWADPATGVPHLASIQACSAILIDSFVQGNVNDDRPPSQDMGKLFSEFEGITKKIHALYPAAGERHRQKAAGK